MILRLLEYLLEAKKYNSVDEELFELEQELGIHYSQRWHNTKK